MLESGIGRAYNVALASLPNFSLPGDLSPSARYWARDVVTPEWTMNADGLVPVPTTAPGLGIEVDTDFIDSITTRLEVVSKRCSGVAVA
jgi:O-succinylbenzoate synthase